MPGCKGIGSHTLLAGKSTAATVAAAAPSTAAACFTAINAAPVGKQHAYIDISAFTSRFCTHGAP
jgi:hypothetical protein